MLTIRENNFRNEEQYITVDSLVPKNHLVRKIENAINFEFILEFSIIVPPIYMKL